MVVNYLLANLFFLCYLLSREKKWKQTKANYKENGTQRRSKLRWPNGLIS
jgi:hypothetical protein